MFNAKETSLEGWLDKFFHPLFPIYDSETEPSYPTPTHFQYIDTENGDTSVVYDINEYNLVRDRFNDNNWVPWSTIIIVFLREIEGGNFYEKIAIAPAILRDVTP